MTTPVRAHPRIYVEVPAEVSSPAEGGVFVALFTHQLGQGGCMLKGMERFRAGRVITLILHLGDARVTAISQVLYEYQEAESVMSGVKFVAISPEDSRVLDDFVTRRLEEVGPEGRESPSLQPSPS